MHLNTAVAGATLFAAAAVAKELPKDELRAAEFYDNGFMHSTLMAKKKAFWKAEHRTGLMDSSVWPRLNYTQCVDGVAEAIKGDPLHTFRCKNMDLYDFINHKTLGSEPVSDGGTGSSTWGWTDPESGREFIANGMADGTALIEILPEGRLLQLGFLPVAAPKNDDAMWKEIRGYKHYMLIGSELDGHGVQIFDMSKLLDVDPEGGVVQYDIVDDVTGHFMDLPIGASHNVVVNEEAQYGVAVGSRPRNETECRSGLIFFDLSDPSNPTKLGCNGDDGYVHDAQCLIYRGPDEKYAGHDICYGYNEDTLTIYDVTDKVNSVIISRTGYEGSSYTHQGWLLDPEWQEYLLMDDEYDEYDVIPGPAQDGYPATYIWDISSLENPKQTGVYKATNVGIDHNQYVYKGLAYQSNYGAGVRVYDISSIPEDPTGSSVCEVAYLDIHPEDDDAPGGGVSEFTGTWASYAMFESGFIFINTIERGAFLAKMTKRETCKKTCNADNCLRALRSSSIEGRLEESQEFCGEFTKSVIADVEVVPEYASRACGENVISRVSSACSCLPTA